MGTPWNWSPTIAALEVADGIIDLKCDVGLNHFPSGRFAANNAWLVVQVMAHTSPAGRRASVWESGL